LEEAVGNLVKNKSGLSSKANVADVDRNHKGSQERAAVRSASINPAACGKVDAVCLYVVKHQMNCVKSRGDIEMVVVATKQQIFTEEKILIRTKGGDGIGKASAKHAPDFAIFLPRISLPNVDSWHGKNEGNIEAGPQRVPLEISKV
jgi:hypothetical protein